MQEIQHGAIEPNKRVQVDETVESYAERQLTSFDAQQLLFLPVAKLDRLPVLSAPGDLGLRIAACPTGQCNI